MSNPSSNMVTSTMLISELSVPNYHVLCDFEGSYTLSLGVVFSSSIKET